MNTLYSCTFWLSLTIKSHILIHSLLNRVKCIQIESRYEIRHTCCTFHFHSCCCAHTRRVTNLLLASVIDLASPYSSSNVFFFYFPFFHLTSSNRLDVAVSVLDLDWSNSHDMLCGFAGTGIILQPQSWDECWHWENMMHCWQSCNMMLYAKMNIKAPFVKHVQVRKHTNVIFFNKIVFLHCI